MKPDPVVVIAGSRALEPGLAPRLLIRFLAGLPEKATVLLRRGVFTQPNIFESQVERLCDLIGLKVEWRQPAERFSREQPHPSQAERTRRYLVGRQATFDRDMAMVADADVVLCFYTVDQIGDEESGTVALVDKALRLDKSVYAYGVDGTSVERVGDHDPSDRWATLVPAG